MGIELPRRDFLKIGSAAGAMLLFLPAAARTAAQGNGGGHVGLYLRLAADNSLTVRVPTCEIGQGTNTSIPMLILEELDYPFEEIEVENFTAELKDREDGGRYIDAFADGAGGSYAIWGAYDGARQAGAKARFLLMQEGALRWGVPMADVSTKAGRVLLTGTTHSFTYGELAGEAAKRPLPDTDLLLRPRTRHTLIGTSQKQKNARAIVTGEPLFGIDQQMQGMLHAVVLRSPWLDGSLVRLDDTAARAVPGYRGHVRLSPSRPDESIRNRPLCAGVAVVADTYWQALKARAALDAEWAPGPAQENSDERFEAGYRAVTEGRGVRIKETGDVEAAFAGAAQTIEARYEAPYVAHAPLEPQNTIAHVTPDKVTIVTPTQQPIGCRLTAAAVLDVPESQVEILPVRCGGGFGRRLYTDMIAEAVLVAREFDRPVKLVWTRECDMTTDLYRPGGVHRLRAALDAGGNPVGWVHQVASASRRYRTRPELTPVAAASSEVFADDHPGSLVPNLQVDFAMIESSAIRGAWRAPGHNINAWAMQSFLDECAHAAGRDPLEYRLYLLGDPREIPYDGHGGPVMDTGRMAGVLRLAAEKAGWDADADPEPGRGRGIASHFSFGTYVCHIVDVTRGEGGAFSVERVVSAIDCGIAVNPNGIAMQNEGAINDALSVALAQAITIRNGQVQQQNFDTYEMMRMARAATNIETHIVASEAPPRGMGEPSLPPFAAALTNALFAATGKRIRRLPIGNQLA